MQSLSRTSALPLPLPTAQAISEQLQRLIHAAIEHAGGWLPFVEYQQFALYAQTLGYYQNGSVKFGAQGDFVTAPELSGLFGKALARQMKQILTATGGDLLELGAGSGSLAAELLTALGEHHALPRNYFIVEISDELSRRQQQTLAQRVPQYASRVQWLNQLPETFNGAILANEVLDAIPTHLIEWRKEGLYELGVSCENPQQLTPKRAAESRLLAAAETLPPQQASYPRPYRSEIQLRAVDLVQALGRCLKTGVLFLIDYGFPEREYYHPQRDSGTLMCHYRHHAHPDPLFLPGLQDITTHINFSAIAIAGVEAGLELAGYTSQAAMLLNCGLTDFLEAAAPSSSTAYLTLTNQAQRLTSLAEMGELFKVLALSRGLDFPLISFQQADRRHTL